MKFLKQSLLLLIAADDNVPLGDHLLHSLVHLLVVSGKQLELLCVDLLQQVVDVDLLDAHRNLLFQLLVLFFQL